MSLAAQAGDDHPEVRQPRHCLDEAGGEFGRRFLGDVIERQPAAIDAHVGPLLAAFPVGGGEQPGEPGRFARHRTQAFDFDEDED